MSAPSPTKSGRSRARRPGDGYDTYINAGGPTTLYRRFPTTLTLLAPYVLLILPPAIVFGNPRIWFLIGVALIALAGAIVPELLIPRRARATPLPTDIVEHGRGLVPLAVLAITTSSIVGLAAAYSGKGSVAAQIGVAEESAGFIGTIDSLTRGWMIVGAGLLFAAYIGGHCSRRLLLAALVVPVASTAVAVYFTQITAPLFQLITCLAMLALFLGVIKMRVVIIGMLAILVLWPTVFELRNELREEVGVQVSESVSATDRLRFDLLFARAQDLEIPLDIDMPGLLLHPSPIEMLRYGIVPRFLDPERDLVSTGQVINVALGGVSTSALSFGPVTTAYVLEGPVYLFFYYFLLSVYLNWIWRRRGRITAARLALLALVFHGPLGWISTFPDTTIGMLQNIVAAVPLLLILSLFRRTEPASTRKALTS